MKPRCHINIFGRYDLIRRLPYSIIMLLKLSCAEIPKNNITDLTTLRFLLLPTRHLLTGSKLPDQGGA